MTNPLNNSLCEWNATEKEIPNQAIAELFYDQAEKNPNQCAAVHNRTHLSYRQLNETSNQLAHFLRHRWNDLPVEHKSSFIVGISIDRSLDMLISILGILKAGGAYVPIDPDYPQERIDFIVRDTGIKFLLSHQSIVETKLKILPSNECEILALDSEDISKELKKWPTTDLNLLQKPNDLAYLIYTSGSTGNPKGVLIEQRSMVNYAMWVKEYLSLKGGEKFDCSSSLSFDFTITTTTVPLLHGGTVFLCDEHIKNDPEKYMQHLSNNKINIIKLVPTYFNLICDLNHSYKFSDLQSIILGGENASAVHIKKWLSYNKSHQIFNEYGPTETTVGVTLSSYRDGDSFDDICIGKPGYNTKAYVLDQNLQPVSGSTKGDLYISGICVGKGYLNREDLSKERFIENILLPKSHDYSRLYKTGDIACWRPDGNLTCFGRSDDQVKINGYRVELGEIEKAINQCPGISQSVVLKKENGNFQYLICFYIPLKSEENMITAGKIKDNLSALIPSYMMPLKFIKTDKFELTINGKIDKSKLIETDTPKVSTIDSAEPEDIKNMLSKIWEDLLEIEEIDPDENFFDLGANSLLVTQFHKTLLEKGYTTNLITIFQYPTINALSSHL